MNIHVGISGLILLMLTGCGGVYNTSSVKTIVQPTAPVTYHELTEEEKARFYDLSFPLLVKPFKIALTEEQSIVGYDTTDSLKTVIQYHTADMEYWGWQSSLSCIADETCLTFRKPSKECVITCRKEGALLRVVIFVGASDCWINSV